MSKISTNEFIETMSKEEKSALLYAESCLVDFSGLLESNKTNSMDIEAFKKFSSLDLVAFGRIPSELLSSDSPRKCAHWITFNEKAWTIAHALRRRRSENVNQRRKDIDAAVSERQAEAA